MKTLHPAQQQILHILSDQKLHSGTELGNELKLSRTAIWKHIKQLESLHAPIESINKQGYRLKAPLIPLSHDSMQNHFQHFGLSNAIRLHLFASLNSTNSYLKQLPLSSSIDICCAEKQTQGRGRFNRNWYSPFGENLYCSSRWQFSCDLSALSGLSLVVSLAVSKTIKEYIDNENIYVKWPNDLIWNGKKICGILIDVQAETNGQSVLIIGVGLNVNSNISNHKDQPMPWCSLHDISGLHFDRNAVAVSLVSYIKDYLEQFIQQGLRPFMTEWVEVDYLKNKEVTINQHTRSISGIALGISEKGELVLKDKEGCKQYISSGDASLKPLK